MFSRWCSFGHGWIPRTSFNLKTVILLHLFLMPNRSEGQIFGDVIMYPNADEQVLKVGETLSLTCFFPTKHEWRTRTDFTSKWKLPEHLEKNRRVRILMNTFFITRHFRLAYMYLIISFLQCDTRFSNTTSKNAYKSKIIQMQHTWRRP